MVKFNCFSAFWGKKEKSQTEILDLVNKNKGNGTVRVKPEMENGFSSPCFSVSVPFKTLPFRTSTSKVKVIQMENENSITPASAEAADQGSEKHTGNSPSLFASALHTQVAANSGSENDASVHKINGSIGSSGSTNTEMNGRSERYEGAEASQSNHISDPGIGKTVFWGSPILTRSCSYVKAREFQKKVAHQLAKSNLQSLKELKNSIVNEQQEFAGQTLPSPFSVTTSCSADKVMLRRRSSRQLLPSRSRRLWWKFFLWSHRSLHTSEPAKPIPLLAGASSQKLGYWSDTMESRELLSGKNHQAQIGNSDILECFSDESRDDGKIGDGDSGLQAPNQWVAFDPESSTPWSRVDEWVNSLDTHSILPLDDDHINGAEGELGENSGYPLSPEIKSSSEKATITTRNSNDKLAEEVLQANNVIRSMNSSSTVAHLAGIGLKLVPNISPFSSLRSVNLSGNFIGEELNFFCCLHITTGSLPKSLHTLNLSRNKIAAIDGLRELTRLRVLDLSYNRISRVGRGLSSCTLIKELYLAGNKISDMEGLHRLLKLIVLDLSFNKITTTKALGQLVANYNSLQALNLVGNPIQSNIGEDQVRKAVSGLLPQLAYLNKQPIKATRGREVGMDSVAKAALGSSGGAWSSRRKASSRRLRQSSATTTTTTTTKGGRGRKQLASSFVEIIR
ncbi:hypothetical protein ACLOJK_013367 [Asimina triloba]